MYLKADIRNFRNQSQCYCKLGDKCPVFHIAAAHSSDQEDVDKQVWLLLPSRLSNLNAWMLHAMMRDGPICVLVFAQVSVCGIVCVVDAGMWDLA
jgi:hypothetical protein